MQKRRKKSTHLLIKLFWVVIFFIVAIGITLIATQKPIKPAEALSTKHLRNITYQHFRPVCGLHIKGMARCHAHVVTRDNTGNPLGSNVPLSTSYGPVQFHTSYNLPCTPLGAMQSLCSTPVSFSEQRIAIVDAYNDPNIESDLNTYDTYYGLPSCTRLNGCLAIVNENGGTTLPSYVDGGWSLETSLDVEVAHMVCQTCKILLVEANNSYYSDLATAVNTAASLGATEISNSYGGSEWPGETNYDSYYNHPGIAVTASSGDNGYGAEYPAASPNVIATGGTSLDINTDNTYGTESVWNGTGSGCSNYEQANSWQLNLPDWNQTLCGAHRAVSDISADADPNTGAAVYDSVPYSGTTGWYQVGGTSLASPIIAGVYALAGGVSTNINGSSIPYSYFTSTNSHDITTGSNGSCGTIMCNGTVGYSGPAGLGTPNGYTGFSQNIITPTPTLTVTPTSTVTPTPTNAVTPTPTLSPTSTPIHTLTFGYKTIGNSTDVYDENYIDGSRFKMGSVNGTLKSISGYVASVQGSPYNQYQLAIYADNNGKPGVLLAKSGTGTLIANSWNTLSLSASLTANTYYWLVYNTNSTNSSLNELKFNNTSSLMGVYSTNSVTYGTWPQTFSSTRDGYEYSMFATYTVP